MKYIFLVLIPLFFGSFTGNEPAIIDKQEAQKAFDYLSEVRSNPDNFSEELTYKKGLKVSGIKLMWNENLAKVAEQKALDMATRNYFGHVDPDGYGINYFISKSGYKLNPDWLKAKSDNYFESLAANHATGIDMIKALIIDKQTPSLGHRIHLLGLNDWNASLTDIGIGFSKRNSGSTYQTYICVIIAKHNW
jgi:uncharacterized protein YkwD